MSSATQWFLLFFIYCFFGWIWESLYVSVRSKKWVNRGFMHGPFLPIYGSGAIVILLSTFWATDSIWLIYIIGMASSTVMEYFTGASMEKLFHVRYWDYSKNRFNLNGHICLGVSLGWGVFSVILVKVINPPIEEIVTSMPIMAVDIAALALTIYGAVDMTVSFNEAMDLKATLKNLADNSKELQRIKQHIDAVAAFSEEDLSKWRDEKFGNIRNRADKQSARLAKILKRNPGAVSRHYKEEMEEIIKNLKQRI